MKNVVNYYTGGWKQIKKRSTIDYEIQQPN